MIFGGPEKSKFTNNSEEKINCVDNLHSKTLLFKIDVFQCRKQVFFAFFVDLKLILDFRGQPHIFLGLE